MSGEGVMAFPSARQSSADETCTQQLRQIGIALVTLSEALTVAQNAAELAITVIKDMQEATDARSA